MAPVILIVDDQPSVLEMMHAFFTGESYRVFKADSGPAALALMAREPVDVVISDERMPGMAGTELLARVRRQYPDTIRIVVTGHADLDTALRAINEGEIFRFFTKPCNMVDLAVTIRHGLEKRALEKENRRLAAIVKRQMATIKTLESQCPGIFSVKRDPDGAVIIE